MMVFSVDDSIKFVLHNQMDYVVYGIIINRDHNEIETAKKQKKLL